MKSELDLFNAQEDPNMNSCGQSGGGQQKGSPTQWIITLPPSRISASMRSSVASICSSEGGW